MAPSGYVCDTIRYRETRYGVDDEKSRNRVKATAFDSIVFCQQRKSCSFFAWDRGVLVAMQEGGTVMRETSLR